MLVGYMRVSTAEQNLALQRGALLAAGVAPERVYEDTCSGTVTSRPGLARALDVAREGDALVICGSSAPCGSWALSSTIQSMCRPA